MIFVEWLLSLIFPPQLPQTGRVTWQGGIEDEMLGDGVIPGSLKRKPYRDAIERHFAEEAKSSKTKHPYETLPTFVGYTRDPRRFDSRESTPAFAEFLAAIQSDSSRTR